MSIEKRTEVAELGEFGLIDALTGDIKLGDSTTIFGVGDDAAVIDDAPDSQVYSLLTTDLLLEGVNFDLTYFPLKHLGYKAVVMACSDIYAMNGTPRQITVSVGVSAKISVEQLTDLYEGIKAACADYEVDLVGGDTSASINGLVLSMSVRGTVDKKRISYRSGAQINDLICITGDLGAAYIGLKLLEREKRVLDGHANPQPQFDGFEYLLRRQLKPLARKDIIDALRVADIVPTSMIDISDGLSSDLLQICKSSKCGVRIYLDRLPIAKETYTLCEQMHLDPVVAALNGGDDHQLLFTVPLLLQEQIMRLGGIDVIGHVTAQSTGAALVTPDGSDVPLTAQGFK